jgi:hypothetical protein
MADSARTLGALARSGPAASWVGAALERGDHPATPSFRALHASVSRRLGRAARERPAAPPELAALARPHLTWTDWVRAALVAAALERLPAVEHAPVVLRLFEGGELGEQESLLRVLALFDEPARFVDTGLLGGRTNARRVFEAAACENPYPSAYFPELGMNQLVMKALFIEVPLARIEGLSARVGAELRRMVADYRSERQAAGRSVPADVDALLGGRFG